MIPEKNDYDSESLHTDLFIHYVILSAYSAKSLGLMIKDTGCSNLEWLKKLNMLLIILPLLINIIIVLWHYPHNIYVKNIA